MDGERKMKLLLDANIILEILLNQNQAQEARLLLARIDEHEMTISLFSLHAIGVSLIRQKKHQAYRDFLEEMIRDDGLVVLSIESEELEKVITIAEKYRLDFDDAYQYALAEKHNLTLVSFDKDFDRTERGRETPATILNK